MLLDRYLLECRNMNRGGDRGKTERERERAEPCMHDKAE